MSILKGSGSGSGTPSSGGVTVPLKQGESVVAALSGGVSGSSSALGATVSLKQVASMAAAVTTSGGSSATVLGSITPTVSLVPNLISGTVSSSSPRVIGKISKNDVKEEVKYWENSVVCYVTGANPTIYVTVGFVRRIWKDLEIDKVGMVNRGVLLVRFLLKEHQ